MGRDGYRDRRRRSREPEDQEISIPALLLSLYSLHEISPGEGWKSRGADPCGVGRYCNL